MLLPMWTWPRLGRRMLRRIGLRQSSQYRDRVELCDGCVLGRRCHASLGVASITHSTILFPRSGASRIDLGRMSVVLQAPALLLHVGRACGRPMGRLLLDACQRAAGGERSGGAVSRAGQV